MRIELPRPHINQQKILDSTSRYRVVCCGRRFGKSELSQIEIINAALIGNTVAYITPTYQLAKTFFNQLIKVVPFENNKSDLIINFPNDGQVMFFTGERLDALRGRKFHLVVIDEASFIQNLEDGWLNSIRPTLTDYIGKALFLSTPKGKNYFHSLFLKGVSRESDWESFKFTTFDNPYIDKNEIIDAQNQLPSAVFEQEYLANAMENASNPFGSNHINDCIRQQSNKEAMYFGIDLAKSFDWSVIIGLDVDGCVAHYERFQKDWKSTKEQIIKLDKNKPIVIDSTGVGDAITEDLQKHFNSMYGFKYTASSKQQLMELLASKIHKKEVFYPSGTIKEELDVFEYQFTATGVRYNAPSGFHDDCVNALALAVKCMNEHKYSGVYRFI